MHINVADISTKLTSNWAFYASRNNLETFLLSLINCIQHQIKKLREELYFSVVFTPGCLVALGSSNQSFHPYLKLRYKICLNQCRWRHVTCLYMEAEN